MQKVPAIRDKKHLKFISTLPCVRPDKRVKCGGDVIAAHIRMGSMAGAGRKPGDDRTVPLCWACHSYQHNKGELYFWGDKLRKAITLAGDLYKVTGDARAAYKLLLEFKR